MAISSAENARPENMLTREDARAETMPTRIVRVLETGVGPPDLSGVQVPDGLQFPLLAILEYIMSEGHTGKRPSGRQSAQAQRSIAKIYPGNTQAVRVKWEQRGDRLMESSHNALRDDRLDEYPGDQVVAGERGMQVFTEESGVRDSTGRPDAQE